MKTKAVLEKLLKQLKRRTKTKAVWEKNSETANDGSLEWFINYALITLKVIR